MNNVLICIEYDMIYLLNDIDPYYLYYIPMIHVNIVRTKWFHRNSGYTFMILCNVHANSNICIFYILFYGLNC